MMPFLGRILPFAAASPPSKQIVLESRAIPKGTENLVISIDVSIGVTRPLQ